MLKHDHHSNGIAYLNLLKMMRYINRKMIKQFTI